ncbi:MAG: trypsin-like serine protease [Candidatus Glassbacteria bacterium]|nr:trypsin-like serine protease [Candidatus Glassbacteria bacterium]
MFKLFQKDVDFCDVSLTPWLIILVCCSVVVLGWGIYRQDELDPDLLAEKLNQTVQDRAMLLANLPADGRQAPLQWQQPVRQPARYSTSPPSPPAGGMSAGTSSLHFLQNAFKRAIESVRPVVVHIKSTKVNAGTGRGQPLESVGSGIIVSPRGHILTNYHVIANAHTIYVSVYGTVHRTYRAWVIDHHEETDLTLLQMDTDGIFTPAELGNSDLVEAGDMVLAIGSPFGMDQTVTSGIVSSVGKTLVIDGVRYENMIQTDAPINRGSSGGPLVNIEGEVIGINTAIYSPTGVFSGTAFAMPVNRVRRFLAAHNILLTGNAGPFAANFQRMGAEPAPAAGPRGWLGVEIQPVDQTTALHMGLPYIGGVLINRVSENSPASDNGVKRGDVILEINDIEILDHEHFGRLMAGRQIAEPLKLLVFSGKELKELFVTLSQLPG